MWGLDYPTGLQIIHANLFIDGAWTVPVKPPEPEVTDDGIDELLQVGPEDVPGGDTEPVT